MGFNHEMLTLARESRGLSQTQLARGLGLSQGEISKIENGEFSSLATVQKVLLAIGYHLAVTVVPIRRKALQVA